MSKLTSVMPKCSSYVYTLSHTSVHNLLSCKPCGLQARLSTFLGALLPSSAYPSSWRWGCSSFMCTCAAFWSLLVVPCWESPPGVPIGEPDRLVLGSGGAAALRVGKMWQCPWSDSWQGQTQLHCWAVTLESVSHNHKFSCFLSSCHLFSRVSQ